MNENRQKVAPVTDLLEYKIRVGEISNEGGHEIFHVETRGAGGSDRVYPGNGSAGKRYYRQDKAAGLTSCFFEKSSIRKAGIIYARLLWIQPLFLFKNITDHGAGDFFVGFF